MNEKNSHHDICSTCVNTGCLGGCRRVPSETIDFEKFRKESLPQIVAHRIDQLMRHRGLISTDEIRKQLIADMQLSPDEIETHLSTASIEKQKAEIKKPTL